MVWRSNEMVPDAKTITGSQYHIRRHCGIVFTSAIFICFCPRFASAEVKLPSIFTDHMVLQRNMAVPVWGWATPGEAVTVTIAGQVHKAIADEAGNWRVTLDPLSESSPLTMVAACTKNQLKVSDILVGEVWICSGQSNMECRLLDTQDADLEVETANYPEIRLVKVANQGSHTLLKDFNGHWDVCSPNTVGDFSAVGYYFALELWKHLHVPIGMIDNSWGGSSCESWISRDRLAGKLWYAGQLEHWDQVCADFDEPKLQADYERRLGLWKQQVAEARQSRQPEPPQPAGYENPFADQLHPSNLYNSRIKPIASYGIRGVIWYQGEANVNRGYQYREMFPTMIQNWRDDWGLGDFPFYWVQLANYLPSQSAPGESAWAELREAQTMTQDRLTNTGQAVIIDLGDGADIHPRDKIDVAKRLARLTLAYDYDRKIMCKSPRYKSFEKEGNRIALQFSDVGDGLRRARSATVQGFAISGADRKWVSADAKIVDKDRIEVSSVAVPDPVAVRYAWADNPVCNVYGHAGESSLPLTPFRTDDWPGATIENR
jgi:sialate O-acetylesterase